MRGIEVVWMMTLAGCGTAVGQYAVGVAQGPHAVTQTGVMGAMSIAVGGKSETGLAIGTGSRIVLSEETQMLAGAYELDAVGPRRGGNRRWFGRIQLGGNLGWHDGQFGGGLYAGADLGLAIGRGPCPLSFTASGSYFHRTDDLGAPWVGLLVGPACLWRRDDR